MWLRTPFIRRLALLTAAVVWAPWSAVAQSACQDSVQVSRTSERIIRLGPGGVVSAPFRIQNLTPIPLAVRAQPVLPTGWRPITPPTTYHLEPTETVLHLISARVPATHPAGIHELTLSVSWSGQACTYPAPVEVESVVNLNLLLVEAPALLRAGMGGLVHVMVVNAGNTRIPITVSADAGPSVDVSVMWEDRTLEPGERGEAVIDILPNSKAVAAFSARIVARGGDAPEALATLTVPLRSVGSGSASISDPRRLPASIALTAFSEGGRSTPQVEIESGGAPADGPDVSVVIRGPDLRDRSSLAAADYYGATWRMERSTFMLGDHPYRGSRLLDRGGFGFGTGVSHQGRWADVGGYFSRTRHLFPARSQYAGFVSSSRAHPFSVGVSYLGRTGFDDGNAVSLDLRAQRPSRFSLEAEGAVGRFRNRTDYAARVDIDGEVEDLLSLGFGAAYAGLDFYGGLSGSRRVDGRVELRPVDRLRLTIDADVYERSYTGAGRPVVTGRYRLRGDWSRRIASTLVAISVGASHSSRTTGPSDDRAEDRTEGRLLLNSRHLMTSVSGATGTTGIAGQTARFASGKAAVSIGTSSFRLSLSGARSSGATFINPVDQDRTTFSAGLDVRPSGPTSLRLSLYHGEDRGAFPFSFTNLAGRLSHRFRGGHEVQGQLRILTGPGLDADHTFAIGYKIPIGLPLPGPDRRVRVSGRVVHAETGAPIQGALVHLGQQSVLTGPEGAFEFGVPGEGTYYLTLDRSVLGLENVPLVPMPYPIDVAGDTTPLIEIPVAKSARISGRVEPPTSGGVARDQALPAREVRAAGATLVLASGDHRRQRTTDPEGTFDFTDLPPGRWILRVAPWSVPQGYRSTPDSVLMDLSPGETLTAAFRFSPVIRNIRIVGGEPVAVVTPGGQAARREALQNVDQSVDSPIKSDDSAAGPAMYVVRAGDRLIEIARTVYANGSLWPAIWELNRATVPDPSRVRAGLRLQIPELDSLVPDRSRRRGYWPRAVRIREGDHLMELAQTHYRDGSLWPRIWLANLDAVADPDRLRPGEWLVIPQPISLNPAELDLVRKRLALRR